jgi:rhodanese-related sulfurtransferase
MKKGMLLFFFAMLMLSCNTGSKYKINALEFKEKLLKTPDALLIDVRNPEDYNYGHIANAINVNWYEDSFFELVNTMDKNKPVFVYCLTGGRADPAAENMRNMGFKHVYELKGGMMKWRAFGFPEVNEVNGIGMKREHYDSALSSKRMSLVHFKAKWSKVSQAMNPILEEIAKTKINDFVMFSVDVDQDQSLTRELKVDALPTIKVFRNGVEVWQKIGVTSKEELLKHLQ